MRCVTRLDRRLHYISHHVIQRPPPFITDAANYSMAPVPVQPKKNQHRHDRKIGLGLRRDLKTVKYIYSPMKISVLPVVPCTHALAVPHRTQTLHPPCRAPYSRVCDAGVSTMMSQARSSPCDTDADVISSSIPALLISLPRPKGWICGLPHLTGQWPCT